MPLCQYSVQLITGFVTGGHIRALACSCLLLLSVARGSTAHLLRTTAAMLMSSRSYAGELVVMPGEQKYKSSIKFKKNFE